MNQVNKLLSKLDLVKGMSVNYAVVKVRDYIDSQPDPVRASNQILSSLGLPATFTNEVRKSSIYALAAIEQAITQEDFDVEATMSISDAKFARIYKMMPFLFKDEHADGESKSKPSRKGAKTQLALEIYKSNIDKSDKEIMDLFQEILEITKPNAYTYLYNLKKAAR